MCGLHNSWAAGQINHYTQWKRERERARVSHMCIKYPQIEAARQGCDYIQTGISRLSPSCCFYACLIVRPSLSSSPIHQGWVWEPLGDWIAGSPV